MIVKKSILMGMMELIEFVFNIQTTVFHNKQIYSVTKEEIDQTFTNYPKPPIISCVDYFSAQKVDLCHICLISYLSKDYTNITNHFPGGFFPNVHTIELYDEHSFEQHFFLQHLLVENSKKQKISFKQ